MAQASYVRCQQAPGFFRTFYDRLLASDPAIPPMFAETRFDRQDRLLQHGLGLLLSYAKRSNPALLERLARRHGPDDLNVPTRLYPLFLESLLQAVRIHDPECDANVEAAWRAAATPGIEFMREFGR